MNYSQLKPYVRQIKEKTIDKPSTLPIRYLVGYQIIIVIKGAATIKFTDTSYILNAGDCMLVPPNEPHSYEIAENYECLFIDFDPNYSEISRMRNISSSIPPNDLPNHRKKYIQDNIYNNLPFLFTPDNIDRYMKYFYEIREAVIENNSIIAEERMIKMLNLFHRAMGIETVKTRPDYCAAAKSFMDARYLESLTLDIISEICNVNKFTLERRFKTRYGTSIIAYYNGLRLEHAKSALQNGARIRDISEELNFYDEYAFSSFFKKHTGVSPKKYKETYLAKNKDSI
ncbi:MAG: helix-turn-helix domain-containing protein [Ruminococcaceae bacterium]|nr:helix-turn-helix domain-containing protein [Oscillospiraceae bacterium]